jgi:hypothetical protein
MATNVTIGKMLTIDETGMPKAPDIRQLQDKDVALLWQRDNTKDKRNYIAEVGVIYYLGDPKSPAKQQGLSDAEALKLAKENFDLPKEYIPDSLVLKIAKKYYENAVGPAGLAIENLLRTLHNASLIATKVNDILNNKLISGVTDQDIPAIISSINLLAVQIENMPKLQKALNIAKENLLREEEEKFARGGGVVHSSMDSRDYE